MRDVEFMEPLPDMETASFRACLASILEVHLDELPQPLREGNPATDQVISRWLAGLSLGLVPIAEPRMFAWGGPWLARVRPPGMPSRFVVMYGHPSGVVWDPARGGVVEHDWIEDGFLVAAADIALARPGPPPLPSATGVVEAIAVAPTAGAPARGLPKARALAGHGMEGDRHVVGKGTFPSGFLEVRSL